MAPSRRRLPGPAIVANVYLEGTYSEAYPAVSQDEKGLLRLVRQFSTPGRIPSHVSVPTRGSIHEGGELGYGLVHAFGAAFDNPDLIVACVVGDREAETGPLEGSWKGIRFLNPRRDGAVLPILQLNGYKISGPTVLTRFGDESVRCLLTAHGYDVHVVSGEDARTVHEEFANTLDRCYERIREIQVSARAGGAVVGACWPAIVLRTLNLPAFTDYATTVEPGVTVGESTRRLGEWLRDVYRDNRDNFRLLSFEWVLPNDILTTPVAKTD